MTSNHQKPYETLDPHVILDAIDSVGFQSTGSLLALNSYENRVYQIGIEDEPPLIAKFYRPKRWSDATILEEHQFAEELLSHEIPVVAAWKDKRGISLHEYQGFRFALFQRFSGRALELDNLSQLEWMGRFIGRLHAVGACKDFKHRPQLTPAHFGVKSYQFLIENNFIPDYLKANFCRVAESALATIEDRFKSLSHMRYIRVHGDLHAGNVLWNDAGPHIVDLDDCIMAPAIQDLWMLLAGDEFQRSTQLAHILQGYEDFHDFNYQELKLIEPLRTLRQLHYCAWLARRWEDPAFPLHFPWFNTPSYWEEQIHHLQEQTELLAND